MHSKVLREIIPLTCNDCFTIFTRDKYEFDFPMHSHEELELNFIYNASDARRIVGNHISAINNYELVLIGPNVPHVWETYRKDSRTQMREITIQFHKDLLEGKFLQRNQMNYMKNMLEMSSKGILFSEHTAQKMHARLERLSELNGFESVLSLLSLLHELSIADNTHTLLNDIATQTGINFNSETMDIAINYINQHFQEEITLSDVSEKVNMSTVTFSRYIKSTTGITFMDILLETRLGNAARMLIDSGKSIADIAYSCGFNNISNFNRLFKKKKGCTPKDYRSNYNCYGNRKFV